VKLDQNGLRHDATSNPCLFTKWNWSHMMASKGQIVFHFPRLKCQSDYFSIKKPGFLSYLTWRTLSYMGTIVLTFQEETLKDCPGWQWSASLHLKQNIMGSNPRQGLTHYQVAVCDLGKLLSYCFLLFLRRSRTHATSSLCNKKFVMETREVVSSVRLA
jgi:hypothetical protein